MHNEYKKKTGKDLQGYLMFQRRGSSLEIKKGKGSKYSRAREKQLMEKDKQND